MYSYALIGSPHAVINSLQPCHKYAKMRSIQKTDPGLHGSGKEPQIRSTVRIAKVGPPLSAACGADSDLTLVEDIPESKPTVTPLATLSVLSSTDVSYVDEDGLGSYLPREADFSHPFKLEVDASATGAGAVLLQEDSSGIDHPVCYYSKKFVKHQLNYSTIEKEALALLLALRHFEVSGVVVVIGCSAELVACCSAQLCSFYWLDLMAGKLKRALCLAVGELHRFFFLFEPTCAAPVDAHQHRPNFLL
ncbi:hypothetical protein SRHO_G00293830 [Serrasalmus rhombeus]